MPGGVTAWRSPAHLALLALAGAGVLGGGLTGVTVADNLYPGAAPARAPQSAPAIAEQRSAAAVRTALTIGASSAASRWPTPSVRVAAATPRRRARTRAPRRHHVAPVARAKPRLIPVRAPAPVSRARPVAAASPSTSGSGGGAISAPVTRPAPVVIRRPAPAPVQVRRPAPRPVAAFDDSG